MRKSSRRKRNQPPPRRFLWLWLGIGVAFFRLKNVGDRPLHIIGEPAVKLVEGC
jgi:hypothetical protein